MAVNTFLNGHPLQNMGTIASWPRIVVCDTTAELPSAGMIAGSLICDVQTGDVYQATSATVKVKLNAAVGSVSSTDISDSTSVGRAVLTAASQAAARSAIGASGDPSNAPGSFTLATGTGRVIPRNLTLASSERATLEGTSRLVLI